MKIFNNLIKEVNMAENMDRGSFDKILLDEGVKDEKLRDKFLKNL